jgi:hypothetical protein
MAKRLGDKQQDIQGDKGSNYFNYFNYLCTYDDLYGSVHNAFDARAASITWASGRGLGPENRIFWFL